MAIIAVLPSAHPDAWESNFPSLNTWKASPNLQHTPWLCRNLETHTSLNQTGPLPSALSMYLKSRWIKCKSSLQRSITNRPHLNRHSVWVGWGPVVPLLLSWIRLGLASPNQPQIGSLPGVEKGSLPLRPPNSLNCHGAVSETALSYMNIIRVRQRVSAHSPWWMNTASKNRDTDEVNILIYTSLFFFFCKPLHFYLN